MKWIQCSHAYSHRLSTYGRKVFYMIPSYTGFRQYTPVVPKLYFDVDSPEQGLIKLLKELDKLAHYASYLAELIDRINAASPEEVKKEIDRLEARIHELQAQIRELELGTSEWDVTIGDYRPTISTHRHLFNDLTYKSMTIKEFNERNLTVKELADCGLNVKGLAVLSYWLDDNFDIPAQYKA